MSSSLQYPEALKKFPNSEYLTSHHPKDYNHFDFFNSHPECESSRKQSVHLSWVKVIKTLKNSRIKIFSEHGNRLEKLWEKDRKSGDLDHFWNNMKNKKLAINADGKIQRRIISNTLGASLSTLSSSNKQLNRNFSVSDKYFPKNNVIPSTRDIYTGKPEISGKFTSKTLPKKKQLAGPRPSPTDTKKPETEAPWHDLTMVLEQVVNGIENPTFPTYEGTNPLHGCLFSLAVASINDYMEQGDPSLIKDAQVAMSCTLNTMSIRACEHFNVKHPEIVQQAKESCLMENMTVHHCSRIVERYTSIFEENDLIYLIRRLKADQGVINAQYLAVAELPDNTRIEDVTLSCLIHLCESILNPAFGLETASEQDWMNIWIGLLHRVKRGATFHTGEKVLESSKSLRKLQHREFGNVASSGRRVDCMIHVSGVETSNIEFKNATQTKGNIAAQSRKNIRLGRCIQEAHKSIGITNPSILMADVNGNVAKMYKIVCMNDIHVCGEATDETLFIPTNEGELLEFLRGGGRALAALWNFTTFQEEKTRTLKLKTQHSKFKSFQYSIDSAIGGSEVNSSIPSAPLVEQISTSTSAKTQATSVPLSTTTTKRRFENNVTFSPSKRRERIFDPEILF